jgi:membrane-bound metal-dependent hydrolase YbcI (DUF457 family)
VAISLAAIAPDVDVLSYVAGVRAYSTYHHYVGHNIFFGLGFALACLPFFDRRRLKVFLFALLAFASHYYGDYFFTRFPLGAFWPFWNKGYIYSYRIGLDHPINLFFSYLSFVVFAVMGVIFKRTPVEIVSPALDQIIVNLFRAKPLKCSTCDRPANEHCAACGQPVCQRHGRITWRFKVVCAACRSRPVT